MGAPPLETGTKQNRQGGNASRVRRTVAELLRDAEALERGEYIPRNRKDKYMLRKRRKELEEALRI
jgi:hypothetical protein